MFCTQDAKLFVPHGRLYYYSHPGSSTSSDRHLSKSASQISLHNFKNISLTNQIQESWRVQRSASCIENCDEELYFKENLLVWSRSIGGSSSQTLRTFTMDSPVIKALWCNFLMPSDKPLKGSENPAFYQQSCVCVVEDSRMSFFCDEGQNYTSHIPMPVKNVWSIQNGLLFERCTVSDCLNSKKSKQMSNKTQKLTTVFSLIHPLDELVPVVHKTGLANQALISFITDVHQEIVFTSENPSIAVTFHHESKKHSVWNVRWTLPEEVDFLVGRCCGDITGYASPNTSKAFEAQKMTPKPTNSSGTLSRHTFASFSPCTDASRLPSLGSKIGSPSFGRSHLSSPNLGSKTAALNRTRSPSMKSNSPSQSCNSPSFDRSNLPSFSKVPFSDAAEPLAPETCLEHAWTEPIISREGDPASKVFYTCDFNSQQFLCLLVGTKQHVKFIKFEESNEKNFVFGNTLTIPAKDAVPLPSLQLLVVLDLNNILFLYSGPFKMNVIHISGLMSLPHFNHSFLGSDLGPTTSSRPASSMDVNLDDVPISPVAHELPSDGLLSLQCLPVINAFNICSLRDPVENRFTIELLEGELCRVEMPEISSSSLVSLCLLALKSCLPKPIVSMLFSKWYVSRNSPGLAGSSAEWTHFASFILTSLGYSDASQLLGDEIYNLSPKSKKRRMSVDGSDSDWMEMLQSKDKKRFEASCCVNFEFATSEATGPDSLVDGSNEVRPDPKAFLYPYVLDVFFNLHLVYEEVKLDSVLQSNMIDLAKFLCHLSQDLDLHLYSDHYCRDLPSLFKFCNMRPPSNYFKDAKPPSYFSHEPPHILQWICLFLTNHNVSPFPNLPGITFRIQHVILMFTLKFLKDKFEPTKYLKNVNGPPDILLPCLDEPDVDCSILLMALSESGMQAHLPPCLIIPVIHAIHNCRKNPPKQWTEEAYKFIGREDLAAQCRAERSEEMGKKEEIRSFLNEDPSNKPEGDGMDRLDSEVLKLRFSKDLRVKEIKKLLQSSVAIKVALQQKLGVSDHEFIDEQEKFLYAVSARTMALPVGRGMLTYGTYVAVPTEALPIPKLCLSGRVPPRNNIIEMTHIELPSNLTEWPQFHNGVAAGLRLTDTTKLDSTWILFNKLKSENMTNEHAGFLMGQGLTGHLSGLACLDVHDYLIKGNEMISIGLLLGMSADKRGTMDMTATKTLSIHISALLPPSSAELDVLHNIQVASVLGIGLVYQSSAHRHISEVLLSEIGRPPGPEMENSVDRESYSLAAGLALGNVMLAKGTELLDVSGSEMPDYLYYYMNGRKRKPMSNSYKERYKATSCQIKEGECVNTDVTAPGAIVALGLMFFNSGNASIADWLVAPDTPSLLECMMPDLLMLRVIGFGLIMWQSVVPTDEWINSNIPEIVKECAFDRCQINENPDCNVDIELMSQAYVNIIAGGCMVIGLKFAGSANKEAFECLYRHFQQILCWQKTAACIDYAGKYTLEQCLCLVVLCMAMVMAGTGDLTVLRICRHLRARITPHVHYGSHMIVGMACGLLVLGGGKCTLSSKPEAVAAMLCAFFPKFPIHANDNRFHLQAFRHLYVLAVEKRILIPCDIDTNKACYAELQLVHENNTMENVTAPCLLPELDSLKEIRVWDQSYWHIEFKKSENWDSLKAILSGGGRLFVKRRINYSLQSKYMSEFSIEGNEFLDKIFKHKDMAKSRGSYLAEFSKLFIQDTERDTFSESSQLIFKCLYNKISEMLPIQVDIHQNIAFSLKSATHPFLLWQFRILCAYHDRVEHTDGDTFSSVSKEFLIAMQNSIEGLLSKCLDYQSFKMSLYCYLTSKEINSSESTKSQLSSYLTWFSIPHPKALFPNGPCSCSFSSLYCSLKARGLSVACIKALSRSMEELQRQK